MQVCQRRTGLSYTADRYLSFIYVCEVAVYTLAAYVLDAGVAHRRLEVAAETLYTLAAYPCLELLLAGVLYME